MEAFEVPRTHRLSASWGSAELVSDLYRKNRIVLALSNAQGFCFLLVVFVM
jgi:hypothetical protein